MTMIEKPRATTITDPVEVAALIKAGKYREGIPLWRPNGETLLVGEVDVLKTWRENRTGKTFCHGNSDCEQRK